MEPGTFLRLYTETALWSSNDESDDSGGDPMDYNYGTEDFAPETVKVLVEDCEKFQADNKGLLERAYELTGNSEARAGHDFWLTRNGHGAGFWDGDWGEFGDELTEAAKKFRNIDLYIGDDGLIYIM